MTALLIIETLLLIVLLAILLVRKRPPPQPGNSGIVSDDHVKLALWGSGEHFWDYDLRTQKLRLIQIDEATVHTDADSSDFNNIEHLPPVHPQDIPLVRRRLRDHLQGRTELF
ncbi:MAG: hypothetical protein LBV45_06895, partial [Xanthomonadaceae bacterium]|nr:hypothetical protein [Xanthomonadaceae bacterium]